MEKFLRQTDEIVDLREKIIGLGERSFKKSFYPELQKSTQELETAYLNQKALLDAIPDALITLNLEGEVLFFKKQTDMNLGFSLDEKSNSLYNTLPSNLLTLFLDHMRKADDEMNVQDFEYKTENDTNKFYFDVRIVPLQKKQFLFVIRDVTQKKQMQNELHYLATRDSLTRLYNRMAFEQKIYNLDEGAGSITIIMCDIDGLKVVNDTFGHQMGDAILKTAASILLNCFGEEALVARIGGDEFGIMIRGVESKDVEFYCKCIECEIEQFNKNCSDYQIGMSFGYAYSESGTCDIHAMYQEADNNMYKKKLLNTRSNQNALVVTLEKALEARDFITGGHTDRMEKLALLMGEKLKFSKQTINDLRLLARFHDIGKIGIPDNILFKPDRLDDQEMTIMRNHCEIGHKIASSTANLIHIAHLILKHHENWDGTGYPYGLKADEIPVECRLLSILDAYDAMTNDRPYRKAFSANIAFREIALHSGTQFDPEMADDFLKVMDRYG